MNVRSNALVSAIEVRTGENQIGIDWVGHAVMMRRGRGARHFRAGRIGVGRFDAR